MNLTDSQKLTIKSKLTTFDNIQGGLGLFLERKHKGEETLDDNSIFQTILDQSYQLKILKDVIVELGGIQDLDPNNKSYLSKFYPH